MAHPNGSFSWIDLMTPDYDRATLFYKALFGWELAAAPDGEVQETPYGLFLLEGEAVAGMGQMLPSMVEAGVPSVWNAYVTVQSLEDTVAKVTANGGAVTVPPYDVPGGTGRLAIFTSPEGATLALWQNGHMTGAQKLGVPGAMCWNELNTRDLGAATTFFSEVFGWRFRDQRSGMAYKMIENQGVDAGGMLQMDEEWGEMPAHWMSYFAVADVAEACEAVRAGGGEVCVAPFDIPVGRIAVVNDPMGATFSLIQMRQG